MTIQLKGGATTEDVRLDRVYELDWRSLNYLVAALPQVATARKPRSYTWSCAAYLDQRAEGACVGFGFAHDLAARPVVVAGITDAYARSVYHRIQREDPWPGGAYPGANPFYEGTSVLTGAKVLTDLKYYTAYDWALNAIEVAQAIGYAGPAVLGLNWHKGMFDTDDRGFISPTGAVMGGHCIAAIGVHIAKNHFWRSPKDWDQVDMHRSYILLHNSWGRGWGVDGRARLSLHDLDILMKAQGEACFPRRNAKQRKIQVF